MHSAQQISNMTHWTIIGTRYPVISIYYVFSYAFADAQRKSQSKHLQGGFNQSIGYSDCTLQLLLIVDC